MGFRGSNVVPLGSRTPCDVTEGLDDFADTRDNVYSVARRDDCHSAQLRPAEEIDERIELPVRAGPAD